MAGESEEAVAGGLDQRGQGWPAGVERNGGILDIFQSHHWQDLLRLDMVCDEFNI